MISHDYNGSACELKDMNNKLIASGNVEVVDADMLEVYDTAGRLPIMELNSKIKLVVYNSDRGTKVMAGNVYISNREFVRLTEIQSYSEYEKRRFFRLPIDHSGFVSYEKDDPDGVKGKMWVEKAMRIRDISLCGVLFESDLEFKAGDHVRIRMALVNNNYETMDAVVCRVLQNEGMLPRYGCDLQNLTERVEQNLGAFIFKQQQAQIRRSRGL